MVVPGDVLRLDQRLVGSGHCRVWPEIVPSMVIRVRDRENFRLAHSNVL
jgi:hypothetical protein